jgi:hypothetical protein
MDIHTIQQILQDILNANITIVVLKYADPTYYYASKEYYNRCLDYIAEYQELLSKQLITGSTLAQQKYILQDTNTTPEYILRKAHKLHEYTPNSSHAFIPGCHTITDCKICVCSDSDQVQHMCSNDDNNIFCIIGDSTCWHCGCKKGGMVAVGHEWLTNTNLDTDACHIVLINEQHVPKTGGVVSCIKCPNYGLWDKYWS